MEAPWPSLTKMTWNKRLQWRHFENCKKETNVLMKLTNMSLPCFQVHEYILTTCQPSPNLEDTVYIITELYSRPAITMLIHFKPWWYFILFSLKNEHEFFFYHFKDSNFNLHRRCLKNIYAPLLAADKSQGMVLFNCSFFLLWRVTQPLISNYAVLKKRF